MVFLAISSVTERPGRTSRFVTPRLLERNAPILVPHMTKIRETTNTILVSFGVLFILCFSDNELDCNPYKLYTMKRNVVIPTIIHKIPKLTKARKNRERASETTSKTLMILLTSAISWVKSERITPTPKNIPTLFQLPNIEVVTVLNTPKDNMSLPHIILIKRKMDRIRAETTKAKKE